MVAASAVIRTSASAPAASWATSVELAANSGVTLSRPSNTVSVTSVSEEAAITTTPPSSALPSTALLHPAASIETDATADAMASRAARGRCPWPVMVPAAIDGRIY